MLEAVRAEAPEAVVVAVSSSEVYGPPASLPVRRGRRPAPAEALRGLEGGGRPARGLLRRRPRPAGDPRARLQPRRPGPGADYAIASFARQAAGALEAGERPDPLVTGSPDTRRDYTDVRDVVRAYRLLAARGEPGIYNVCSGVTRSARELVAALGRGRGRRGRPRGRPGAGARPRGDGVRGDAGRLRAATGWAPEIPLERTLADTVAGWRERIRAGTAGDRLHE